jgi:hypothetical protein
MTFWSRSFFLAIKTFHAIFAAALTLILAVIGLVTVVRTFFVTRKKFI